MADALARHGGQAMVAPSMREVPDKDPAEALAFAEKLIAGRFDVVILLTGVGTRHLIKSVADQYTTEQMARALQAVTLVARGPKPVAALRGIGITADIVAPSPNTWREVVTALTQADDLAGKHIAIQEYGQANQELAEALVKSGATVTSVQTYRWQLPEDLGPLKSAIRQIIDGRIDVAVFTSAQQIRHLFQVAQQDALDADLRAAFGRVVIASVGPSCTEAIRSFDLAPDDEPDTPNMGSLIKGLVRHSEKILHRKRLAHTAGVDTTAWRRVDMIWPEEDPAAAEQKLQQSAFLKACRREPTDYTPIWLMRQAGRFQRAYRDIRAKVPFIELCKTPELAAEVTLMAVDQLNVDAAIIFSDILPLVEPMGIGLGIQQRRRSFARQPHSRTQRRRSPNARQRSRVHEFRLRGHPIDSDELCHPPSPSSASRAPRSPWPPTFAKAADRETTCTPSRSCIAMPALGTPSWPTWSTTWPNISTPKSPPAPRACNSSTVGSGAYHPLITTNSSSLTSSD